MDGMKVQITGTDKMSSIPYLIYAEDYAWPFSDDHNEKIQIQTIEFAMSFGMADGGYILHGSEDVIANVREAILAKNAEEQRLYQKYNQNAQA